MNRAMRSMVLASLLVVGFVPSVLADPIQDAVNQVSQSSYTAYLTDTLYTRYGDDRGFGAAHDLARTNIFNAFQAFNLAPYLDAFTYGGNTYYNVVATRLGSVYPNRYYIVGAHYDSVNNPGADDDASGVAGVLEAARVLSQYDFDSTLIFIAFDREEQGLVGSNAYATSHAADDIRGMVAMDMIAYNPSGASALIYGRPASNSVKTALAAALAAYGGLTAIDGGILDQSDHAPFEWRNKPAALLIESYVWSNPYYHQPADSVDTANYLNYAYATDMTRGVVGYLALAAGIQESVAAVPEPSALVLLGSCGVLAVFVRGRVRRRAA